ncbi:hypothetical protein CGJ65_24105 [Vibrio parahaemolyticus]|nr:hypothetical protein CGJ65_24105 [Vibrio parahaemolyticus]
MSAQILESLQPLNMPNFVGCLIGFHSRLVVSLTGSKCGKGKLIEVFILALSLQLWVSQVQNLRCC